MSTIISTVVEALVSLFTTTVVFGLVAFFVGRFFEAKVKSHFDRASEDYKFGLKTREQGARIAEYAALAGTLEASESRDVYRRANQLSWELFLWLPDDVYRKLGRGVGGSPQELVEAMVEVRLALLGDEAGNLGPEDIIVHAPNIGRIRPP